jgi:branched-chain amino acid transport system substrate-binding protein
VKKVSVIAIVIVVLAAIISGAVIILGTSGVSRGGLGVEKIRIGAIVPLTGPFAQLGSNYPLGFQPAIDEINSKGGVLGAKLRLIVYDDKNDAKEAVAAFQRLVEVDRVVAVVGLKRNSGRRGPRGREIQGPSLLPNRRVARSPDQVNQVCI